MGILPSSIQELGPNDWVCAVPKREELSVVSVGVGIFEGETAIVVSHIIDNNNHQLIFTDTTGPKMLIEGLQLCIKQFVELDSESAN